MKKVSILLLLLFSGIIGFSQTLDEINDLMAKKDYAAAKAGIDKYMADPKNAAKPDGWYYKGRAYNSLSYEKTVPEADLYDLKNNAYEAFRKYQQLDPGDVRMKLENYASYLDLYFSLYDLGANLFNNKKFTEAYTAFKKALEVEDYILNKKYTYTQATLHPLDTALVLNTAIAATQAKKEDEAIPYYKKLVDANIAGDGYKDIYEYLVDYYNKKGDAAAMADILAKGKKYYPTNNFWNEIELANVSKSGDQAALFAKYDELLVKEPTNYAMSYNYAVELYNSIWGKDAKAANNTMEMKDKLTTVLKTAISNDQGIDATVLMSNHLWNIIADYNNEEILIKGTKPDDIKKKNAIKALKNKKMDECIPYAENAVKYFESKTDLKPLQKANYKIALNYLSDIYNLKGDKKKSDEYAKKQEAVK